MMSATRVGRLGARSGDDPSRRLLGTGGGQDELGDHVSGARRRDVDLRRDGSVVDELDARRAGRDARRQIASRRALRGARAPRGAPSSAAASGAARRADGLCEEERHQQGRARDHRARW